MIHSAVYKRNLGKRIAATLIDYCVVIGLSILYVIYFGEENDEGFVVSGLASLPLLILWFLYFVVVESMWGATIGHMAMNLKVLRVNRTEIRFVDSLKRRLLDPIDIVVYGGLIAFVVVWHSAKHQRLGDLIADTIVVDTNDPQQWDDLEHSNYL